MEDIIIRPQIPDGYEVDKEKSTFENIVLKPVKETYEYICRKLFYERGLYFINHKGGIGYTIGYDNFNTSTIFDKNNCTSEKQAQKLLAINQLMNVAKYLNDGQKPDWKNENEKKYVIALDRDNTKIIIEYNTFINKAIVQFKTKKLAQRAIEILGEETIKLALSTDW